MRDENPRSDSSKQGDSTDLAERVTGCPGSNRVSRRGVLRRGASALATGSLLTAGSDAAIATHQGGELDVRTTDVEVLDDASDDDGQVRAKGEVSGMSNYDCERCEVGAHVRPAGSREWHGGLQTLKHTRRDTFQVGVTLAGLHPGKYECRLCACPITVDDLFVANVLIVVVSGTEKRHEKKHDEKKEKHHKEKDHKKHDEKKHHDEKKLKRAYRQTCPCPLDHPRKYHLMICGGDRNTIRRYTFRATTGDISRVDVSNAPDVVAHRHVSATDSKDSVTGRTVRGAVAGGGDSYVCGGELTAFGMDDGASVYVNGVDVTDDLTSAY